VGKAISQNSVQEHLEKGDRFFEKLNNERALTEYQKAYDAAPTHFEPLLRMSRLYNDLGRLALQTSDLSESYYRKAIGFAEQLHRYHPDRAESYFMLALCHGSLVPFKTLREKLELGRDVEHNARKALTIDSTFSMAYVVLGIFYRSVSRLGWMEKLIANTIFGKNLYGTLEDSESMLKKALHFDPANSFAYFELASTYRAMGREEAAVEALRKVLALEPKSLREHQQLEVARRRLDQILAKK
jgi:tetratricopeptide (TPR) repeat protein